MLINHYLTLGVSPDASAVQLKRAYHALAAALDPDRSGDPGPFEQARLAYEALSDPRRKAEHDRALGAGFQHGQSGVGAFDPGTIMTDRPVDLIGGFASHHPSVQQIMERLLQNFTGQRIPKSCPLKRLQVELVLSPDQARAGGTVPLHVPIAHVCERCAGTGRAGLFVCDMCEGHGVDWQMARVDVLIPRGTQSGTMLPVSLRHLGIRNLYLNLHIRVSDTASPLI